MFRDTAQRGKVCYLLCAWIPGSPWRLEADGYRPTGPKPTGKSTSEMAMVAFARALWRGDKLGVPLGVFDARRWAMIATLFSALGLGPDAVDEWIETREAEES